MDYSSCLEKAEQQYLIAEHLLKITYPLVQDPKLLLGIADNLLKSLESILDAWLTYEKQQRLISDYPLQLLPKLAFFRLKLTHRNNINPDYLQLLGKLQELLDWHQSSSVEFQRNKKLVICNQGYRLKVISASDFPHYLTETKAFLDFSQKSLAKLNRKE